MEKNKNTKFFSGFIEINFLSIILNRSIPILADIYYKEKKFYKQLTLFNNIELRIPNLN